MVTPTQRHIPQLDGLRAFAILPVLLTHSYRDYPSLPFAWLGPAGWIGVDLFFVLSGFLITRILLQARGGAHYFRDFYARRGLRIWPLYYLVLGFMFVLNPHWHWVEQARAGSFWVFALYLQNFVYGTAAPMPLAVTWSLAIEEHFYLLWPLLVARFERKALVRILVALIVAQTAFRLAMLPRLGDSTWTIYCVDELAYGALLACWLAQDDSSLSRWRPAAWAAAALVPLTVAMISKLPQNGFVFGHGVLNTLLGAGFAGVTALALTATPESWMMRVLGNGFLRHTGKISYGMYLYHAILFPVFQGSALHERLLGISLAVPRDVLMLAAELGMVYVVSSLSWYGIEQPILRLKRFFEGARGSSAAGSESKDTGLEPVAARAE
ncbi:MAG TPA: acyltransferase [Terriglobales bacterium]|nr:acyltransferase [Terriglobales bacterium]